MIYQWFGLKTIRMVSLDLTSKRVVMVSPGLASKPVATDFFSLYLKIGSYGLVICDSKSPEWFLNLCLKIKWTTGCRLRHKIDGRMKTVWGTR
jgi:hypothetical protein